MKLKRLSELTVGAKFEKAKKINRKGRNSVLAYPFPVLK